MIDIVTVKEREVIIITKCYDPGISVVDILLNVAPTVNIL